MLTLWPAGTLTASGKLACEKAGAEDMGADAQAVMPTTAIADNNKEVFMVIS
jgi:hypothetical protein